MAARRRIPNSPGCSTPFPNSPEKLQAIPKTLQGCRCRCNSDIADAGSPQGWGLSNPKISLFSSSAGYSLDFPRVRAVPIPWKSLSVFPDPTLCSSILRFCREGPNSTKPRDGGHEIPAGFDGAAPPGACPASAEQLWSIPGRDYRRSHPRSSSSIQPSSAPASPGTEHPRDAEIPGMGTRGQSPEPRGGDTRWDPRDRGSSSHPRHAGIHREPPWNPPTPSPKSSQPPPQHSPNPPCTLLPPTQILQSTSGLLRLPPQHRSLPNPL